MIASRYTYAYLADAITKIVNGHPENRLNELLPWAYPAHADTKAVAREHRLRCALVSWMWAA